MDWLLLVLASVGASAITSQSELFRWLHRWGDTIREHWPLTAHLTTCMQCQSVWWTLALSAAMGVEWRETVLASLASSGVAWVAQMAVYRMGIAPETQTSPGTTPESPRPEGLAHPEQGSE